MAELAAAGLHLLKNTAAAVAFIVMTSGVFASDRLAQVPPIVLNVTISDLQVMKRLIDASPDAATIDLGRRIDLQIDRQFALQAVSRTKPTK